MKRTLFLLIASIIIVFPLLPLLAEEQSDPTMGRVLFQRHCSSCHPKGGNILNPEKTLHKKDLEANGIMTARDVINKMRNPSAFSAHPNKWSGMKIFDEKTMSDKDAMLIADYILKSFK